jgi:hypothetical protein
MKMIEWGLGLLRMASGVYIYILSDRGDKKA